MDDLANHNRERWNDLVRAGVEFGRPWLNLQESSARRLVDPHGFLGDVRGKEVLCLAGAGGQQTAAFSLLGANTTVLDLSDEMLEKDRQATAHYGFTVRFEQGDMRDLSRFANAHFDVVWHAYSINFVPRVGPVFDEVRRVLRPGGLYRTEFHNPFVFGLSEDSWDGNGYPIRDRYIDGAEATDTVWDVYAEDGSHRNVQGPREFRHALSTMLNGLAGRGFLFLGLWEEQSANPEAEPGTWDHYMACCPPWFQVWARLLPDARP